MSAINNLPGLAKFNNATHEVDGLMSRNDKQKLDSLHKSVTIHTTLYASEWSANRPYTQTIDIPDITSTTNGTLTIDPTASDEEMQACIDANITIIDQSINHITLQVTEVKPEIDIPVIVVYGENLAVINSPTIVDTGNQVQDIIIQSTDWVKYLDTYKASLHVPGINESLVGSISMKSGILESEAVVAAKARIEIFNVSDDTVELILRGERPNIPLHVTVYFGPSISIVRRPVFGGKITPHAMYQEFDDSKTGLGVTNTQSALEELTIGSNGVITKAAHFKTIDVLKDAMHLQPGQLVITSGYRTENDGGGATYIIAANSEEDDGGAVHKLKNGLKAILVQSLGEDINLKCFGLYGDGIHDDTPAFKRAFNHCKKIKGGTVRWQGIAAINEPLIIDSHYINLQGYGYGSTIKANFERDYVVSVTYEEYSTTEEIKQINIGNFRIDGNHKAKHGLVIDDNLPLYDSIFENIFIENTMDFGIIADSCSNSQFNLIITDNCYGGLNIDGNAKNLKFNNCQFRDCAVNQPLSVTNDNLEGTESAESIQFNGCYFGDSESNSLITIDKSLNIDFDRCTFDLRKSLSEDYAIVVNEYALYTRFTDCFLRGRNKTCGVIKSVGPHTAIRNFKAIDIKSDIHILAYDNIHISDVELVGDSTPLRIHTPNDNKSILDINSVINAVDDDEIVFPSNADYYNIYMNQKDEIGIKGKANNYILDKHLENEEFERIFTSNNASKFDVNFQLLLPGIWEIDMFLNIDDGNQGKICKYQFTFKSNSVYSVANVQRLINPIEWGNNIKLTDPTVDKNGNVVLSFTDTTNTNRSTWALKLKLKRIMSYDI